MSEEATETEDSQSHDMPEEAMKKQDAVTVLNENNWREHIWQLPVLELLFVGRATTKKLIDRAVFTIGDLAKLKPEYLLTAELKSRLGL